MNDQRNFRDALGAFATGVTIVTATTPQGERLGVTANSFNSVSLDPPLVLVSLARNLRSFQAFEQATHFAVNLLTRRQQDLCMRFARPGEEKWAGLAAEQGVTGAPLIPGRLAHFECSTWARYDGGDHLILVGEVQGYAGPVEEEPLIYFRGSFPGLQGQTFKQETKHA